MFLFFFFNDILGWNGLQKHFTTTRALWKSSISDDAFCYWLGLVLTYDTFVQSQMHSVENTFCFPWGSDLSLSLWITQVLSCSCLVLAGRYSVYLHNFDLFIHSISRKTRGLSIHSMLSSGVITNPRPSSAMSLGVFGARCWDGVKLCWWMAAGGLVPFSKCFLCLNCVRGGGRHCL